MVEETVSKPPPQGTENHKHKGVTSDEYQPTGN